MVLTTDTDPGAVGVGSNTEDVHGRIRPGPVGVRHGLQRGGRGRDDHIQACARDLRRDGVGNGQVALSVVVSHFEAVAVHVTPRREPRQNPPDAFVYRLQRGELHQSNPPHGFAVAVDGSCAVFSGV